MDAEIIIIGAGAAGLMAARELGKAGKKVLILEARDRIGGRIMPLDEADFGFPAQGGAEWVHGEAPVTKALVKEAGLTLVPEDGEIWSARNGALERHRSFMQSNGLLKEKLSALVEDISIADFLEKNFAGREDSNFRNSVTKMVEGYDAADPKLASTLTLRDEWLSKSDWDDHRIKEGYGALLDYLEAECESCGVSIGLGVMVKSIRAEEDRVSIVAAHGKTYVARRAIITVPLPVLKDIEFGNELKEKISLASRIGFGQAIKLVIRFKDRWWKEVQDKDLSKMAFMLCNEKFLTWWTQYPQQNPVLVGWMAGPEALKYNDASPDELLQIALGSLENVFKIKKEEIKAGVVSYKAVNWQADHLTRGAYSYTTIHTGDAYEKLGEPVRDILFFAGEAFSPVGDASATVEGALASGQETARKILSL